MRARMMWIRGLTAGVLFLLLAKVNVWADKSTHLTLAAGYRAFLLCAPAFMFFGLSTGMRAALGLTLLAAIAATFSIDAFTMGALAIGMAVSGYIAKFVAAHSTTGAADNKVSLNLGSLGSGLVLLLVEDRAAILWGSLGLLSVALALSWNIDWSSVSCEDAHRSTAIGSPRSAGGPLATVGWGLIGVATGIKLTGIFAVLPQYLILRLGTLPPWFGALVIVNSVLVVAAQHRVLRSLDRLPAGHTLAAAASAMILLALPAGLGVESLPIALAWILLLTLGECALSRYDRFAMEAGHLFSKELMVGVGSFATVWLSRTVPEAIHWSGALGTACMLVGAIAAGSSRRRPIPAQRAAA